MWQYTLHVVVIKKKQTKYWIFFQDVPWQTVTGGAFLSAISSNTYQHLILMRPSKVDGTEHQGDSSTQRIELHPQNGPPSVFLAVLREASIFYATTPIKIRKPDASSQNSAGDKNTHNVFGYMLLRRLLLASLRGRLQDFIFRKWPFAWRLRTRCDTPSIHDKRRCSIRLIRCSRRWLSSASVRTGRPGK